MKKCNECLLEKELEKFPKSGGKCKSCVSVLQKIYYQNNKEKIISRVKEYTEKNIDKVKEYKDNYNKNNPNLDYHKEYRENNKELVSQRKKEHYQNNKEKVKEKVKQYCLENRDIINQRRKENRDNNKEYFLKKEQEYIKNRKINDPLYRLTCSIRTLISQSFKSQFTKKAKKTIEILGCDFETFKVYIESQFTEDMNWNNYAEYWQLDHKTPVSWAKSEEEIYKLNHYTNFQPLYWVENYAKGNRWSH